MTGTKAPEYRDLEHESSSQLMEYDSRRVLGRYPEAAYHALQAGCGRARMGQLGFEAGEYAEAVEDWLSAVECFLLATAPKQAAGVLNGLHRLEADGKIPEARPELLDGLRQREQGLKDLNQRVQRFLRDCGLQGHRVDVAADRALHFLLQQVRDLPGYPLLHYAIFRQASDLRKQDLADEHLIWATTLDPDNANYVALLGYRYIALGQPDRAVTLGNDYVEDHASDNGQVRIMLAIALSSGSGDRPPDQERAIDVLRPLLDGTGGDVRKQVAALALSATFQYELGREQESAPLLQELDRLEGSVQDPELRQAITDFRGIIPRPQVNGPGKDLTGPRRLLPEGDRLRLFQKAKQVSIRPMEMAA
jgi:tetratricopeptide (TPR) repeat protein